MRRHIPSGGGYVGEIVIGILIYRSECLDGTIVALIRRNVLITTMFYRSFINVDFKMSVQNYVTLKFQNAISLN